MPLTYINSYTGSSVATVDIPLTASGTVIGYRLSGVIIPVDDGQNLRVQVTNDGFSTVESGSVYEWVENRSNTTTESVNTGVAQTLIRIATNIGNAAGEFWAGRIHIILPHDTSYDTGFVTDNIRINNANAANQGYGSGLYDVAESINGVRLTITTGNISSYDLDLHAETV